MAVKIRLQRHGKKDSAYYHMVVADGRAPRNGKFIEKLGFYNPTTNPATINIDFDTTLGWLMKGAQPTDTCRAILSYKGIMMKKHLLEGVKKGALTETQADERFTKWQESKQGKILGKYDRLKEESAKRAGERQVAETAKREARAAKIAAKQASAEAESQAAENAENTETPPTEG
jgi:small subunit ribosomal protein S16